MWFIAIFLHLGFSPVFCLGYFFRICYHFATLIILWFCRESVDALWLTATTSIKPDNLSTLNWMHLFSAKGFYETENKQQKYLVISSHSGRFPELSGRLIRHFSVFFALVVLRFRVSVACAVFYATSGFEKSEVGWLSNQFWLGNRCHVGLNFRTLSKQT